MKYAGLQEPHDDDRLVAVIFAAIVVGSLIFDLTHASFWQHRHDLAPVASLLVLLVLAALLARHRWAWWVFTVFGVVGLAPWVAQRILRDRTTGSVFGLLVGLVEVGLLLSVPMRRYVRVGQRRAPSGT